MGAQLICIYIYIYISRGPLRYQHCLPKSPATTSMSMNVSTMICSMTQFEPKSHIAEIFHLTRPLYQRSRDRRPAKGMRASPMVCRERSTRSRKKVARSRITQNNLKQWSRQSKSNAKRLYYFIRPSQLSASSSQVSCNNINEHERVNHDVFDEVI